MSILTKMMMMVNVIMIMTMMMVMVMMMVMMMLMMMMMVLARRAHAQMEEVRMMILKAAHSRCTWGEMIWFLEFAMQSSA